MLTGNEVHARSVFLQGVLLSTDTQKKVFFKQWKSSFEKWNNFCEATGDTPLVNCIKHVNSHNRVSHAVVGIDSAQNLSEVFKAFSEPATRVAEIDLGIDHNLINPACWNIA